MPFALAAGLSGEVASSGLGGSLAARSDVESYRHELARERQEVKGLSERETEEVRAIFSGYGLRGEPLEQATQAITSNPDSWVPFMMRNELGMEELHPSRVPKSALTIGGSYVLGGIIPLIPYAFGLPIGEALQISVIVTLLALAVFGAVKASFTGVSVLQTTLGAAVMSIPDGSEPPCIRTTTPSVRHAPCFAAVPAYSMDLPTTFDLQPRRLRIPPFNLRPAGCAHEACSAI